MLKEKKTARNRQTGNLPLAEKDRVYAKHIPLSYAIMVISKQAVRTGSLVAV